MTKTEKKLIDLGMQIWEKCGKKRLYINEPDYQKIFGLYLERFNTGNISYAEINGEKVSNNYIRKLFSACPFGIFYDCKTNKWNSDSFRKMFETLHFSDDEDPNEQISESDLPINYIHRIFEGGKYAVWEDGIFKLKIDGTAEKKEIVEEFNKQHVTSEGRKIGKPVEYVKYYIRPCTEEEIAWLKGIKKKWLSIRKILIESVRNNNFEEAEKTKIEQEALQDELEKNHIVF